MSATIAFVVTEHPTHLDPVRRQGYERVRQMIERLAGARTRTVHSPEAETLAGEHAVVLSGSKAPWAEHEPDGFDRLGDVVAGGRCPCSASARACSSSPAVTRTAGSSAARAT
jgi:hypothetical protein